VLLPPLEKVSPPADKTGVHPPFPIDEVFRARVQDTERSGSASLWNEAAAGDPLLAQVEPFLGKAAEPDPMFFVESWTFGVTAASENYLRRHQEPKNHESAMPAGFSSFSCLPFFNIEPPAPVAPSPVTSSIEPPHAPSVARPRCEPETEPETEPVAPGPLTFYAACQLLGVAATSTREQIKAAYRRMASRYHPDRLEHAGTSSEKQASDRMASINEAYRLLCTVRLDPSA
jgi:DnaJ-domain-containing protein 1